MSTVSYDIPVLLTKEHDCGDFDCGHALLNDWLRRYAMQNQQANAAKTFVVCQGRRVIGYYSLAVGAVDQVTATERVGKMRDCTLFCEAKWGAVPVFSAVMVLARLAVDLHHQGKKIGRCLLRDAILRTLQAADIAGIRAIFVSAKDERARGFYERFGFEPSPIHSLQLMLLIKDCQKSWGSGL